MQVIFLQTYYSSMKKSETIQIGNEVENAFKNSLDYKDQIDNLAYRNSASIYLLTLQGDIYYSNTTGLISSNAVSGNDLYKVNFAQMPGRNVSVDITDISTNILNSPNKKVSYTLSIDRLKTKIYVYGKHMLETEYCYVIIMSIDPIDATSSVIRNQLMYITVISLFLSTIVSLFLSRRITKPIEKINETAKSLEKGNFDVTFEKTEYLELNELVDTLNATTIALEKTDKIKRELISNVSHDLKTPLTMIKAYSEMIRDLSGDNKEKREQHIKVIIDEANRLTRLVNDMMDLSGIESGSIVLNKEKFDISEVIKDIVNTIKNTTEHKIDLIVPNDVYVYADKTKIEQVLYNLLTNAIKHSGDKSKIIQIKVSAVQKRIKTEVIDDGIGISEEELKHIWDRYYRVSKSFTRNVEGSGLGLSIVKNILVKHSSNFGVKSDVGKGTNFWFDLERISKKEMNVNTSSKEN